ncbi:MULTISPECIES: Uma2 family endonuclease [unclassified Coleofasciculus]|uniref:Uma2 family endonuclease n=1 Tax=unclassified Coleofasciculus TaxID=2692782 RepID=UPI001882DE5E|nr:MULTISPECIES: Uma2 family endonuclease [unclassified Coleofasciculus]MBE9127493.1 Uma2 family endonuclease [Coleofasciculus sp. LEGE 07081]MBE9150765.1 Uma2 family endonuclease [Coleofasciculus sp. LEGE 07092]
MIAVPHYISPKDYLDIEHQNPIRHEYRRGLVYAMAGGTDNHDRLALNLLTLINLHLGDSECRFHSGNVKVNYQDEFYYYPDAFVTCDPRDRDDRYIKRYPKLIVEVLSPSTQAFDLGEKFDDYRQLESLKEYVLIFQGSQRVECRRRTSANTWETVIYGAGDCAERSAKGNRVSLKSIDLEFAIAQLYRGLDG